MRKKSPKPHAGDYKVGKGRPPRSTRWTSGQSGNPRGRPRGSKNLVTILADALNEKLEIQERGKTRPVTAREAIVRRIVHEALKGNLKGKVISRRPTWCSITIENRRPTLAPKQQTSKRSILKTSLARSGRNELLMHILNVYWSRGKSRCRAKLCPRRNSGPCIRACPGGFQRPS
jgi:hypothetical protein